MVIVAANTSSSSSSSADAKQPPQEEQQPGPDTSTLLMQEKQQRLQSEPEETEKEVQQQKPEPDGKEEVLKQQQSEEPIETKRNTTDDEDDTNGDVEKKPTAVAASITNTEDHYHHHHEIPDNLKVRRILVLGAGMSGLAAARELQSRGYQVLVLEARDRPGGRLKAGTLHLNTGSSSNGSSKQKKHAQTQSADSSTVQVDLGGALIHGITDNPVYTITQQMGVATQPVSDCLLLSGTGWPVDPKEDERVNKNFNDSLEETFRRIHQKSHTMNGNTIHDNGSLQSAVVGEGGSFGELFQKVCAERNVNRNAALFRWHQANLEVSCGASFDEMGLLWNEDEPYGFDGDHNAVNASWKTVCDALAEPLDVMYSAEVARIEIVPPEEDGAVETQNDQVEPELKQEQHSKLPSEDVQIEESPAPEEKVSARKKSVSRRRVAKRKDHSKTILNKMERLPTRQSRRIRGEDASTDSRRRSTRSNRGTGVELFTVDHSSTQLRRSASPTVRKRRSKEQESEQMDGGDFEEEEDRTRTAVHVTLSSGTTLRADAVVCTLPLGILKTCNTSTGISFDPPLPESKLQAIERLGTGLLNKCALTFQTKFWQDSDFLGLADDTHSYLVINSAKYTGKPVLMFMYGGAFAREIEEWTDAEIVEDCLAVLKRICGHDLVTEPLDYQVTRWGKEEYSRMSFTYIPPGVDGIAELQALSDPICDHTGQIPVLMFAGEHTTPFHPSTIHGAFLSGIREAYRLDCLMDPVGNENLEFSREYIYQKTFHVKRKYRGSSVASARAAASAPAVAKTKPSSAATSAPKHRRRGAAGVMKLRSKPKTIIEPSMLSSPSRKAASTPTSNVEEGNTPASRRSQRSSSSAAGLLSDASNIAGSGIKERGSEHTARDLNALEDRCILRGVESYGEDLDYILKAILPVHGGSTEKSMARLEKRYREIRRKNRRRRVIATWQSWMARIMPAPLRKNTQRRTTVPPPAQNRVSEVSRTAPPSRKTRSGRVSKVPRTLD